MSIQEDTSSTKSPSTSKHDVHDSATETSPLLPNSPKHGRVIDLPPTKTRLSQRTITLLILAVVFIFSCGDQIMASPTTRIIESVICYRYYEKNDPSAIVVDKGAVGPGAIGAVPELQCKNDEIQEQLAVLRGYLQLLSGLPSLLLAVPFGWGADRFGRKPFILLGLASITLQAAWIQCVAWNWQIFDIHLVYLSALYALMGGGSPVLVSLIFVALSDITAEVDRAAVFLRLGAFNLSANLAVPPLAAWLMTIDPWVPALTGTLLLFLAAILATSIPETLDFQASYFSIQRQHPASPSCESATRSPPERSQTCVPKGSAGRMMVNLKETMAFLTQDWRIPALIVAFAGHGLINDVSQLLLQFISKRYHLTFAKGTLLLTIMNAVKVVLLVLILPYVSKAVTRLLRLSSQRKDLYLARVSQALVVAGWTLIGISPNIAAVVMSMAIASLGMGSFLLLRSFITSLVPAQHIARVYSMITVMETLSGMCGGAVLAGLYSAGLSIGGMLDGMPFFFIGLVSTLVFVVTNLVKLRPGEDV